MCRYDASQIFPDRILNINNLDETEFSYNQIVLIRLQLRHLLFVTDKTPKNVLIAINFPKNIVGGALRKLVQC